MLIGTSATRQSVAALALALVIAALGASACQSPTEDETPNVADFVVSSAEPNPATADRSTGRTYRVVRGNNQPDEILEFDWQTAFGVSVSLTSNATSDDVDLAFPVTLGAASIRVQQASGGIVNPPTTGTEYFESVTSQVSGNTMNGVNQPITMVFNVWYDLPSLNREALITVTLNFTDDDGKAFTKTQQVRVSP